MAAAPVVFSHWYKLFEGLQVSPMEFYGLVEEAVNKRALPNAKVARITWQERGLFSARRDYLRARRGPYVFDICGAPFGNGFFVSWWLGEVPSGFRALLLRIPYVGFVVRFLSRPSTYYEIDTALMFQSAIHSAVLEVLDQVTNAGGIRGLSEGDRQPILRELLSA